MDEKDLENINQIDMECRCCDDDEDSFGQISGADSDSNCDDRSYQRKTNIILNFNDETSDDKPIRTISADIDNNGIKVNKNFNSMFDNTEEINAVDMETDYFDEDDEDLVISMSKKVSKPKSMFDDSFEEDDFDKELIDNDLFEAKTKKSKQITTGEVEADYWDKLAKRHASTNKKGAYNTHFHLSGNPKLEMELFNHDMTTASNSQSAKSYGLADIGMDLDGQPSGESIGSSNICGTGGGEAMGESLTEDFCDIMPIFNILGFTVVKNPDCNNFKATDDCNIEADIEADNMKDLISKLSPYIDDCFIYPLQIQTGEKFKTCDDWVNWYTMDKQKEFPKCKNDIKYCKVLANYLK